MKIIGSTLLIIIVFGCGISFSQEDSTKELFKSQHLLSLSSGICLHSIRDEMMSPLIYSGNQIPIEFSYRFRGLSNRHTVLFYYDNSELNSSITNKTKGSHFINNLNLNFEYSFATKITSLDDLNTNCFIGSRFSSMLNLRKHYFLQDKSHLTAEQMNGLGIYFLTETTLNKETNDFLRVEINIPFVSYTVLNNHYNANVSEDLDDLNFEENVLWQVFRKGNLVSFNKLFQIQADISYNIFVSRYIGFDLQYRFQYYSFKEYKSLLRSKALNNQFLVGLMVKL